MPSQIQILHVDDEPDFGDLVSDFLERENSQFEVATETDPTEGLDYLENGGTNVDCIVSDHDMPIKNGLEFLDAVRDSWPDLPFILFTGKGSEEVASEAISAGVTEYMQKEGGTDQYTVLANRIENSVTQHRSKMEAEETKRRLQELTESSVDCLWIFNKEWTQLHFISGYEDVWQRPVEAILESPQDFLNGVQPDYREYVKDSMNRVSNGDSIDIEYGIIRGDHDPGWVWVKGEPIRDDDGEVVRVAGFTRDVTDRKKRQQELEETKYRYETVVEQSEDGIGIVQDGDVIFVNQRLAEMVGYTQEELLGMRAGKLIVDEDVEELRQHHLDRLHGADSPNRYEVEIETKDGRQRYVELSVETIQYRGEPSFLSIIRDVSERKSRQ